MPKHQPGMRHGKITETATARERFDIAVVRKRYGAAQIFSAFPKTTRLRNVPSSRR